MGLKNVGGKQQSDDTLSPVESQAKNCSHFFRVSLIICSRNMVLLAEIAKATFQEES